MLRFGVVFSNAGYMSIPLQKALLGEDGVLVGAAYLVVFNLVLWSYGLLEMSGDRRSLSVKKLVFNPGMIGLAAGLVVFLLPFPLPEVFAVPIRGLSALNTPLPMLVIGYYLGQTDLKQALRDKQAYWAAGLRLVVLPLLSLRGMWLCGLRGTVLVSCMIAVSAPCGGGHHHVRYPLRPGYRPVGESGVPVHPVFGPDHAPDRRAGAVDCLTENGKEFFGRMEPGSWILVGVLVVLVVLSAYFSATETRLFQPQPHPAEKPGGGRR